MSLRSDLHRLFDRGYVTVDGEQRFVVGRRLKDEFENGKSYYGLQGQTLALPPEASMKPSAAALAWHRETVLLGYHPRNVPSNERFGAGGHWW